jgi:hypothetical protein
VVIGWLSAAKLALKSNALNKETGPQNRGIPIKEGNISAGQSKHAEALQAESVQVGAVTVTTDKVASANSCITRGQDNDLLAGSATFNAEVSEEETMLRVKREEWKQRLQSQRLRTKEAEREESERRREAAAELYKKRQQDEVDKITERLRQSELEVGQLRGPPSTPMFNISDSPGSHQQIRITTAPHWDEQRFQYPLTASTISPALYLDTNGSSSLLQSADATSRIKESTTNIDAILDKIDAGDDDIQTTPSLGQQMTDNRKVVSFAPSPRADLASAKLAKSSTNRKVDSSGQNPKRPTPSGNKPSSKSRPAGAPTGVSTEERRSTKAGVGSRGKTSSARVIGDKATDDMNKSAVPPAVMRKSADGIHPRHLTPAVDYGVYDSLTSPTFDGSQAKFLLSTEPRPPTDKHLKALGPQFAGLPTKDAINALFEKLSS